MGKDILKAKLDIVFKKLFTDSNNKELLHDFLSSILEIPHDSIKDITILNPEVVPDSVYGKFSRLDLRLQVDETLINVELQVKSEDDFRDRALFYWSKLYSSDLKAGDEYGDAKQSITVNIINFNIFDCPEYHSVFKVKEDKRGEVLTDKLIISFFELRKIGKEFNKDNRKELWLKLVDAETEEELTMLEQTNVPEIQKAVKVIYDMSEDSRIREAARMREKMLYDEGSAMKRAKRLGMEEGMEKGMEKGRKEGMEEGRREGRREGIEKGMEKAIELMKKSGMPDEEIDKILKI